MNKEKQPYKPIIKKIVEERTEMICPKCGSIINSILIKKERTIIQCDHCNYIYGTGTCSDCNGKGINETAFACGAENYICKKCNGEGTICLICGL